MRSQPSKPTALCPRRLGVLASLLNASAVLAQSPVPLLPIETLFAKPNVSAVQISPDGAAIAVIERAGSHTAIALYSRAAARQRTVYQDTLRSITNVRWSRDGRWLLLLHDRGGDEGYHLLRLDPTRTNATPRDLTPFPGAEIELLSLPDDARGEAIISSNHRDRRVSDAYRVSLATGRLAMLAKNPGDVTAWGVTARGHIRAATAVLADGTLDVRTRRTANAPFRSVYRAPTDERFTLLGIVGSESRLLVRTNRDSDFEEFRWLNLSTGAIERRRASVCTGFDAGELYLQHGDQVLGESCTAQARRFVADDSVLRVGITTALSAEDSLRATELESVSDDRRFLVFFTHASTDPGRFVLIDRDVHTVRTLFETRPDIDRAALARTGFYWFTARDGLRLSALLTLSRLNAGTPQPVVMVVHGGPWTRDDAGFSPETQLLASRGYAVLQVNFRGSTGLGRATVEGAVGEFGGRMSDDLLDALGWAASLGAVDTARVCVLGGSYGGYAALVAMTRDAQRFKCGID